MLTEEIQSAVKSSRAIFGYRESIKFIKSESPKMIVVANNLTEERMKELEHNARTSQIKFETFGGTSRELGTFCGLPYPVSVLVVKG